MHLLLTLHHTPNWTALATRCELPLISTFDAIQEAPGYFLCEETLNNKSINDVLPALLNQLPSNSQLWLGVNTAENFLTNAVAQGLTLTTAANNWRESIQALLDIQRQQRQRVRIFNLDQALAEPHNFCAALELNQVQPGTPLLNIYPALARLAAAQYLFQNPDLQNLNMRLQATCTPVGDYKAPELDIDSVLQQQLELTALHKSFQEKFDDSAKERDLILMQLHKVQEELEAYHGRSGTLQAELEKSKKALSHSEDQLKVVTEKHDLLLAQLNKAKEELQTSHGQYKALQAELDKTNKALNTGEGQLKEVTEERDLILAQLHKVQEELETYYLKLQEKAKAHNSAIATIQEQGAQINSLTQERDALRTNIQQYEQHCKHLEHLLHLAHEENLEHQRNNQKAQQDNLQLKQEYAQEQQDHKHALLARDKQYTREATKLEAELRKTKARAANAEYSKLLLQRELDKLRHSISWKAASPVRAIGRLIRKNEPAQEKLTQEIGLLLTSEYFDVDWYLRIYTDVAESNINPAEHYLLYGAAENRLPGPLFDGNWYLQRYPDVAEQNINPLLHFILFGQQEGRDSSPILLSNDSQDSEE
jgi:predicted  nucleic acid-binding Zn-ribbon protein